MTESVGLALTRFGCKLLNLNNIITRLLFESGVVSPQALVNSLRLFHPRVINGMRRKAFRDTLRLARARSSFYREKFLQHGIDVDKVRSPEEMGSFFLTSEDLRKTPESFLCAEPGAVIESSGTTGHAAQVFLNQRELDYNARQGGLLKAVYNVSDKDRILSTFDYGFCLDGMLAQRWLSYWKVFHVCVGRVDPMEIHRKMESYRFNVVMSGTPWLARFTEVAEQNGRPYPLKLLIGGGGGGVTDRTRKWIENFWEAPLCMTYACTEAATVLGFECLERRGYHINELDFFIEILEPDSEGYGEVVMTTVHRRVMPLIRYRTRDVARFIDERCPCGIPLKRLSSLRGRLDEMVASVWGNVHPDFLEGILRSVPGISEDWQVALYEKEGKQTFQFRLEFRNGAPSEEETRELILGSVEDKHKLAWDACRQRLADVEVVYCDKGSLRKGRKIVRLVDERRSVRNQN